jgi:hypothetical protein
MRKIWNYIIFALILAGFPLLLWAGIHLSSMSLAFWREGKEENVRVVQHVSTSAGYRQTTSFTYRIEKNGKENEYDFSVRLPVGKNITVLTHPSYPDDLIPATREDSWFHLYSLQFGSKLMGAMTLGMFLFMLICGPGTLRMLIKNRNKILNQMNS